MVKVYQPAGAAKQVSGNVPGKFILFCIKYPTKFVGHCSYLSNSLLFTGSYFAQAAPDVVCRRALHKLSPRIDPEPNNQWQPALYNH
jgi:hypothetical protein